MGGDPRSSRHGARRVRRARPGCGLAIALVAALSLVAPAMARPPRIQPADEAATHTYLAAYDTYEQAVNAASGAIVAAEQAWGAKIGSECRGALAGVPVGGGILSAVSEGPPAGSPREQGERARQRRQLQALLLELLFSETQSAAPALSAANGAFTQATRPLHWTSAAVNAGVQLYRSNLEREAGRPVDACADIRAWAASGYKSVSSATRDFVTRFERPVSHPFLVAISPLSHRLRVYEGPPELALVAAIRALEQARHASDETLFAVDRSVHAALGLPPEPSLEELAGLGHPKKGAVTLAHGRTAAGERFTAVLEPPERESGCQVNVSIESSGGTVGTCYSSRDQSPDASVECNEGRLTISAKTLPRTRSVSLRLSNGHTIASRAIVVPKRLGGPVGVYHQVVRGPSPIPVSLTELDARGRTLRVVHLTAVVECTRHPLKYLPGGLRTLARVTVPGGPTFKLVAEHYRFLGHTYFSIKAEQVGEVPRVLGTETSSGGTIGPIGHPRLAERLLTLEGEQTGCEPRPYVLIFGVLKAPRDIVLVRTGARLSPLSKVPMPKRLGARGALVYGLVAPPPEALVIRGPGGRTIVSERVFGSRQIVERCEGEAEPATPAPVQPSG